MDECEEGCTCAACGTLVMGPNLGWVPVKLHPGVIGRCVFCQTIGDLDHYTALGMGVGVCCGRAT